MDEQKVQLLLRRYIQGNVSREDLQDLYDYFGVDNHEDVLSEFVQNYLDNNEESLIVDSKEVNQIVSSTWSAIHKHVLVKEKQASVLWFRYVAAVFVLAFVSVALYFYLDRGTSSVSIHEHIVHKEPIQISNSSNKPTLTFVDGATLVLDENKGGLVIGEEISYADGSKVSDSPSPLLVLSTPAGSTFSLTLSDGTKVHLNAMSTLTYPTTFTEDQRKVQLEGEAYFEVTSNKQKPFIVNSNKQQIRVLGTRFNVKSYMGDRTITTLLEGEIEVGIHNLTQVLLPGESSIVDVGAESIEFKPTLMYNAIAWLNNEFSFYNANLGDVGAELSRWYDVDVQVMGKEVGAGFTGLISKDKTLEEVLEILKRTGQIRYHISPIGITERRIILMV